MKRFLIIFVFIFSLALLPGVLFAIELQIPIGSITEVEDLGDYIRTFYALFVTSAGVLATVMIVLGGYIWITAAGNAQKISNAKETIISAILGLVLALTSYVILNTVNPSITALEPLVIPLVKPWTTPAEAATVSHCSTDQVSEGQNYLDHCVAFWFNHPVLPDLNTVINEESSGVHVGAPLIKAIMKQESSFCVNAQSDMGACGAMQLLPATAERFATACGVTQATDCDYLISHQRKSVCLGAHYLDELWVQNSGDLTLVVAGYNGGQGANAPSVCCSGMTQWQCPYDCQGGVQTANYGYAETRDYVAKVEGHLNKICEESGGEVY